MDNHTSSQKQGFDILKRDHFNFKKKLGQNFLIDENIIKKIVKTADINQNTGVIEIGPGIGAITREIAEQAGKVVAIEIDSQLIEPLNELFKDKAAVKIIHADVMKLDLKELIKQELVGFKSIKIIANLPYYITSPILIKILESKLDLDSATVMVQKEVAERIVADPGGKEYGSLTLFVEYFSEAKISFYLPNTVFVPRPKVDSAVLHLKMRGHSPYKVENEELLFKVIRASFNHRRKTLLNNLKSLISIENKEELLRQTELLGIDLSRRAETLSLKEFADLSNMLIHYNFVKY